MNLHDAIIQILQRKGEPLSFAELAFEINQSELYERKDRKSVKTNQIQARVNRYPDKFITINGYVIDSGDQKWGYLLSTYSTLNSYLREHFTGSDIEFIISSLFFYKRIIDSKSIDSHLFHYNTEAYKGQHFISFRTNYVNDWFEELFRLNNSNFFEVQFVDDLVNLIKRLDIKILLDIIETLRDFNSNFFSKQEFGKAFEYILEVGDLNNTRSNLVRTPRGIIELMTKILNPISGKLLDPVCGTGGFLTEANRLSSDLDLLGVEISYEVSRIAKMNLIVNGGVDNNIKHGNCFSLLHEDTGYDYIIGDLPIEGGNLGDFHYHLFNYWGIDLPKKSKSFGAFLLFSLSKLSFNGKAIFTISDSFLYRKGSDQKIRNLLLENDVLETIISLPGGALKPYTKGKASIIVLNNNKHEQLLGRVKFIDVSNQNIYDNLGLQEIISMYETHADNKYSQIVSLREIIELKTLNPRFFTQDLSLLRDLLLSGDGKYLGEIVNIESGKRILEKDFFYLEKGIPVIKIENLEKETVDMFLSKSNVSGYLERDYAYRKSLVINKESILIAKIGENLKPTYFKPTNDFNEIVIHQNVLALLPITKDKVSLQFLYYQLNSDIVKNQIENLKPHSVVPFLTISSIKEVLIPLPNLESQEKFIGVQKANIISAERSRIDEKLKRLGIVEEAEERELDVVRTITHQLRHKLVDLNTFIEKARSIIDIKGIGDLKQYDPADPILIFEEGFEVPENENLETILKKSEEKSLFLSALLTDVEKAINLDLKFKKIELLSSIKRISSEYKSYTIQIEVVGENVEVEFSERHLKDLIDTLIQNAKQHSFKREGKKQKITFKVKPDLKRKLVVIEYLNNGAPLEISQKEYISILTKSKSSNGSGIGGYYINKIIKAHGGLLNISENLSAGIKMKIEIPIKQNKELNE
ncbi:Type I restriction-modification system, DNA methylase subunit [Zunongwangia mangrovi]|uniref:site-specific DNA-methyltransferase (adenine-specific) n=1 Tax=Zunongwangia mangrovi TaxID=1334022 RepID=A0A1I1IS72_9FLAO|nr:N-6 DNA methylase [Zunongwangia mangrovi]SFC39127.1 Type I restriction-modification system, DNA methylase subunit [Zunongwangia mangrovi]